MRSNHEAATEDHTMAAKASRRFSLRQVLIVTFTVALFCGALSLANLHLSDRLTFTCWFAVVGVIHFSSLTKTAAILSIVFAIVALVPAEYSGYPSQMGTRAYTQFIIPSVILSAVIGFSIWAVVAMFKRFLLWTDQAF